MDFARKWKKPKSENTFENGIGSHLSAARSVRQGPRNPLVAMLVETRLSSIYPRSLVSQYDVSQLNSNSVIPNPLIAKNDHDHLIIRINRIERIKTFDPACME